MKIGALILFSLLSMAAAAQSAAWPVKLVAAPTRIGDGEVKITVATEQLTLEPKHKKSMQPQVVPMSQVTSIIYSTVRFNRAEAMDTFMGSPGGGDGNALLGYLIVAAIASGMHGQKHYFTVDWVQDGVEQQLMLEAPKDVAPHLIDELQKSAGPKWMNMEARCAKVTETLTRNRDAAFDLQLQEAVNLHAFHLAPGAYKALLLDGRPGESDLYLFANSVEPANLRAIAAVEVIPANSGNTAPTAKVTGKSQLAEVQLSDKILRVR